MLKFICTFLCTFGFLFLWGNALRAFLFEVLRKKRDYTLLENYFVKGALLELVIVQIPYLYIKINHVCNHVFS